MKTIPSSIRVPLRVKVMPRKIKTHRSETETPGFIGTVIAVSEQGRLLEVQPDCGSPSLYILPSEIDWGFDLCAKL